MPFKFDQISCLVMSNSGFCFVKVDDKEIEFKPSSDNSDDDPEAELSTGPELQELRSLSEVDEKREKNESSKELDARKPCLGQLSEFQELQSLSNVDEKREENESTISSKELDERKPCVGQFSTCLELQEVRFPDDVDEKRDARSPFSCPEFQELRSFSNEDEKPKKTPCLGQLSTRLKLQELRFPDDVDEKREAKSPVSCPEFQELRSLSNEDEKPEKTPCLGQSSEVADDDEGFKTPTSSDHKIPLISKCPPPPRKKSSTTQRKVSPRIRRSLESMFQSTIQDDDASSKIKKARLKDDE